jgi:kynurenine 3-monooxygenase
VTVYERGPAPGQATDPAGRSINLALAARGIRALEQAEVWPAVQALLLPMAGRIVHDSGGGERFLAYGQGANERIWSVSRADLNQTLYTIGRELGRIDYRFGHDCANFDAARIRLQFRPTAAAAPGGHDIAAGAHDIAAGRQELAPGLLLAADGAGSIVRRELAAAGIVNASEDLLDHGYKELTIPPRPDGSFALSPEGLHIWPRGGFMLIALPNLDRSFTATLFLPRSGAASFDTIGASRALEFFAAEFGDVLPLMPDFAREFRERPVGLLGTVRCEPWSHTGADGRQLLLIGDAAHAIVPFHGQGMNAAFEDCASLDRLLGKHGADWPAVIAQFEAERRDNARAIAAMALENYAEMRDGVRDPAFERRARLAFELERHFPERFIPRYSMVMFHPEIAYAEAERRGHVQAAILDEALAAGDEALAVAQRLVAARL